MRAIIILLVVFLTSTVKGQDNSETEIIEEALLEGYYANHFENSGFYVINGNAIENHGWLIYSKNIVEDSIWDHVTTETLKADYTYIKFRGTKKTGKRYGHFGGYKFEYTATDIIDVDSLNTLNKFLHDQIKKKGHVMMHGQKAVFPDRFLPKSELAFNSVYNNYNFDLIIEELDNGSISYKIKISDVRDSFSTEGVAVLDKNYLKWEQGNGYDIEENRRYVFQIGSCATYIHLTKDNELTAFIKRACYDQPLSIWPLSGELKLKE